MYSLRYNDLIAPMVKAVQELKAENDGLKTENSELKERLLKLEEMQNILASEIQKINATNPEPIEIKLGEK